MYLAKENAHKNSAIITSLAHANRQVSRPQRHADQKANAVIFLLQTNAKTKSIA
jgi:hypothetical protein